MMYVRIPPSSKSNNETSISDISNFLQILDEEIEEELSLDSQEKQELHEIIKEELNKL